MSDETVEAIQKLNVFIQPDTNHPGFNEGTSDVTS